MELNGVIQLAAFLFYMLKSNCLYKHKNNKDVSIYVKNVKELDTTYEVDVYWYNNHYRQLIKKDKIWINKEDIENWRQQEIRL